MSIVLLQVNYTLRSPGSPSSSGFYQQRDVCPGRVLKAEVVLVVKGQTKGQGIQCRALMGAAEGSISNHTVLLTDYDKNIGPLSP